jgi:hypothetical protein
VWNNPLSLTVPTGLTVEWEDSKKKKKEDETEAKSDAQRKYEKHLQDMINSKDAKERARGLKLQADYQRLKDSDITFHVRRKSGKNSGELSYEGKEGHLYVDLKGDNHEVGLTEIQKIAHEFRHGNQFLDGEVGFRKQRDGTWGAHALDVYDESEAMMAGFSAESISVSQISTGENPTFFRAMKAALPEGQEAVNKVMKFNPQSPYKGIHPTRLSIDSIPNANIYAIPKKKQP